MLVMTEKQLNCYKKIYEVTRNNMIASNEKMKITEEAFLVSVESPEDNTDIAKINQMSVQPFLQAVFCLILHRFPDDNVLKHYEKYDTCHNPIDEKVKTNIIKSVVNSQEYSIKQRVIKNNVFQIEEKIIAPSDNNSKEVIKEEYISPVEKIICIYPKFKGLYNLYKKLPEKIRRVLRHLWGGIG